ncbi:glutamine amidotransferase [Actinomyces timonensis]|uniref:Lipid II isoglutaminyl synthase (glutamine-hydrolyzing) subunit GatD n=1 Tax=Actinomyces timonensis TaxID=1288391 RepID=A0AAU8N4Y8_9ACTO
MSAQLYEHSREAGGASAGALRVLQLYPRDMNIYGDWGNTLVLARRAQWRGYDVEVLSYDPGDELPDGVHLVVGGGGQDSGQERITADLQARAAELRAWATDGVPMLVICGLYQLFGHRFVTAQGSEIPGISVFDAETVAGHGRLIGNITTTSEIFGGIVGYENHSGLTTLALGQAPFGRVRSGDGNNGQDGTEGALAHHVIGTYLHGSLLPKNPAVADWLLERAAKAAGLEWVGDAVAHPGLDGAWAERARAVAMSRPR